MRLQEEVPISLNEEPTKYEPSGSLNGYIKWNITFFFDYVLQGNSLTALYSKQKQEVLCTKKEQRKKTKESYHTYKES